MTALVIFACFAVAIVVIRKYFNNPEEPAGAVPAQEPEPAAPDEPDEPDEPGELHNLVWSEAAFNKTYTRAQATPGVSEDDAEKEIHGKVGEQHVMNWLCRTSGCAVFWNVGIAVGGRQCEIDQLLLTPEGIILIECKNMRGTWEAVGDDERPNEWARTDYNEKQIHSPFSQVTRTGGILVDLLKRLGIFLPVQKIIVFVDPAVRISGIRDDRAFCCYLEGLPNTVQKVHDILKSNGKTGHPLDILQFMAFLAKEGVLPAFFDQRLILSFINPTDSGCVDASAVLGALFNLPPLPVFCTMASHDRPRVVSDEYFSGSIIQIIGAFNYPQIQDELSRPASGMAFPATTWDEARN